MDYILKARNIFLENTVIANGEVLVKNGVIAEVSADGGHVLQPDGCGIVELGAVNLTPGFVDIHTHGAMGGESMDATYESINEMSLYKLKHGTTSFCPSTVTGTIQSITKAVGVIADAMDKGTDGARVLGTYLEGPYICKKYRGAHIEEYIREIDINELDEIIDASRNTIKVVIIAPEKKNALEAIRHLVSKGVRVTIGHTDALFSEATSAIEAGASIATHTFNAMRPLAHREPGVLGAVLTNGAISAEAICDGVHIHAAAIEIILKCKGADKVILVTDSMSATGLKDGDYSLGAHKTIVKDGVPRLEDGTLAGSTLNLHTAVKNVCRLAGAELADAINMATINPARAIGVDSFTGSVAVGKRADLIALDDDFNVRFVMLDGEIKKNEL